ncbi:MAG TPA: GNAT family N-acetyltransferase [Streptosporangiaceae bacterium]|nr:GNAT family N-acetyltransferase [Streptosporangiaceae bacterium]
MRISVLRPAELGDGELGAWHGMQRQSAELRNPFLCPEFAVAVGSVRQGARVAVLDDGSGPRGFFPFERGRLGVGRPIGAGISDCQGLVTEPGARVEAGELLRGCGLSVWHFDHLIGGQQPFSRFQAAAARSPAADLSSGFGPYADQLWARSARLRADLGRKTRKLEREAGPLRFEIDVRDTAGLRTLMGWKSEQYRRTGRADRFDHPWIVGVVDALFASRPAAGSPGAGWGLGFRGVLSMLYAGGKPVAGHFGLVHGGVLSEWFPAYDASYSKYSPGLMQLIRMSQEAAGLGVRLIDFGKGDKYYKEQLKTFDLTVAEGTAASGSPVALMHRARLAPPRWAARQIRAHDGLFTVADRALKWYGHSRVALRDRRLR